MTDSSEPENEILDYLLDRMGAAERRRWEARLAAEPQLQRRAKAIADGLAAEMLAQTPAADFSASERGQTGLLILTAAQRERPGGGRRGRELFWAAAAMVLLALNIGQWTLGRRGPARAAPVVSAAPAEHFGPTRVVYAEPAALKQGALAPTITLTFKETIMLRRAPVSAQATSGHAWYDAARRQGLVELRNLPAVPPDCALELWVSPAGAGRFVPIGIVPRQFYGGSGTLAYRALLEREPARVLITLERAGAPRSQPSSAVVLRGP